jgi:hypothetical protein
METWTEKGLKLFLICQLVSFVSTCMGILAALAVVADLIKIDEVSEGADPSALGAMLGIACILATSICLIALALLVLYIISIVYMAKGRNEFGPKHASNVTTGIVLIVVGVLGSMVPILESFGGVVIALGYVFLIMSLVKDEQKAFLWGYLGIVIFVSLIGFISAIMAWDGETKLTNGINGGGGAIGLVGLILLMYVYYTTWKRIQSGELRPVPPPAPPVDMTKYDADIYGGGYAGTTTGTEPMAGPGTVPPVPYDVQRTGPPKGPPGTI